MECPGGARDYRSGSFITCTVLTTLTLVVLFATTGVDDVLMHCQPICPGPNCGSICSYLTEYRGVDKAIYLILRVAIILCIVSAISCGCFKEVLQIPRCPDDCNTRYVLFGRPCFVAGLLLLILFVYWLIAVGRTTLSSTNSSAIFVYIFALAWLAIPLVCCGLARLLVPEEKAEKGDEDQSLISSRDARVAP
ncbi:unnamed protein product [Durusdinium trenchii]|uniref:Uncharacterized protein n=2 Tax=Durusdinium trenchii TaxID=1381693 RepID=A0ABP0LNZ1_9DINO